MLENNNIENRSCCCDSEPMPMVKTYSYQFTNIGNDTCEEKMMMADEMLEQIRCLGFAINDLAQYLDTHVDDSRAICLHKEYANQLRDLADKYQRVYGPLTITYPCNKWRWVEEPWPWERGSL